MSVRSWLLFASAVGRRPGGITADLSAVADADLVRRFLESAEPEAFGELVERHHRRLHRLAVATLGPDHAAVAEEVVQEALMIAYRTLHGLTDPERVQAWLSSITYRRAVDYLRTPRARRPHTDVASLVDVPADHGCPDALTEAREQQRRIERGIRQLPPPLPVVIRMHYWLGCTVEEIAASLDVQPGTVKSYLFRARHRLHDLLGSMEESSHV